MHNMPGLPVGEFAIRPGPMMASYDVFEIEIEIDGRGSHGAMPHQSIDPVVIAAQIVVALQTIVSRNVKPLDAAVVSVTRIHGGDTWNVIPDRVVLGGTTRCFQRAVAVATEIVGDRARVAGETEPVMGSEDFAFMLEKRPDAYIMIGNGGGDGGCMLHNRALRFQRRCPADRCELLGAIGRAQLERLSCASRRRASRRL